MGLKDKTNSIPGVTWEEEKKMLSDILGIADENLNRTKSSVQNLAEELHELKEIYDVEDKEGLALWFNTDARFQHVRQELLRMERSRKKPYFGRIDFTDPKLSNPECYYIGKAAISKEAAEPVVIDWRAPIASVYYEKSLGTCSYFVEGEGEFEIELSRKRTYEIDNDELKDFYDSDVVANDELLTKYLAKNKRAVLSEIIATIQQEQNEIIRKKPQHNIIVQGGAGSGKTTVAMHRISYILYNYELEFKPKDFYIIGSNRILLNYITGILPDLDVYGVTQMTMEQLFVRLLYEDWDKEKFTIKSLDRRDRAACVKGSFSWFHDLEDFCRRYEWEYIPRGDVYIEKTHHLLMTQATIEKLLTRFDDLSLPDKLDKLTEHLTARLENEIYGKYHTYPAQEQKALLKRYQTYFGRREWKGSIFELYDSFLKEQCEKGHPVLPPGDTFDLYDLAALAYLYKRIKETEVIQEASHVVIDEAQDFGMMVYGSLKYCLSMCTFTIMGDVSQNICFDYGLTDWEDLKGLMLPGKLDYFGVLKKSYRNTVEISNFAINILQHGNFPVYPVEPIIRHGNEVHTARCKDEAGLVSEAGETIENWQKNGYETIAVICRDEEEAVRVSEELGKQVELRAFDRETEEFGSGVMVLPIEYSKGLEFDAVLIFNANDENYPAEDGYTKLLYVAATRALHELTVLYCGRLTDLIAAPVPEEKKQKYLVEPTKENAASLPQKKPKTNREIELERAADGHREMEIRNKIGPKRIVVQPPKDAAKPKVGASAKPGSGTSVKPGVGTASKAGTRNPARVGAVSIVKAGTGSFGKPGLGNTEFGTMPDTAALKPLGRSNKNPSIRWISGSKDYLELNSACGVLRITPVCEETVRISFSEQALENLPEIPEEIEVVKRPVWKYKDMRDRVEIRFGKLMVQVDKKNGVVSFYTGQGKLLTAESASIQRQIARAPKKQTWAYFDWGKKELIKARGSYDKKWVDMKSTARYISFGEHSNRPACVMSNNGYQILIPGGRKTVCCTIPLYGCYLSTEEETQIDYFFRTAL